jgi:hypothetical protein
VKWKANRKEKRWGGGRKRLSVVVEGESVKCKVSE